MPFIDDDKVNDEIGASGGSDTTGRMVNSPDEVPELAPSPKENDAFTTSTWGDLKDKANTIKDVFEDNTAFGSLLKYGVANKIINDPNYNVTAKIHNTPYQPYASEFIGVDSDAKLAQKQQDIQTRLQHLDDMHRNPDTAGIAGLISGVVDPINLVPMMSFAKTSSLLTDAISGAAQGAGYGAGFMGYTEGAISASGEPLQESKQEKLASIGVGAFMGATLGAGIGFMTGKQYEGLKDIYEGNLLNNPNIDGPTLASQYNIDDMRKAVNSSNSAGAMEALVDPEMSKLAYLGGQGTIKAATKGLQITGVLPDSISQFGESPVLRAARSESDTVRSLNEQLFRFAGLLKKNTKEGNFTANVPSVDQLLDQDHSNFTIPFQNKMDEAYIKYTNRMREEAKTNPNTGKMLSPSDFNSEAALHHWQGSQFTEGEVTYPLPHTVPEINEATEAWKTLLEAHNKRMSEAGVMPTDLTIPEKNYFSVVPDHGKINADPLGFQSAVAKYWQTQGLPKSDAQELGQRMLHDYLGQGDFRPILRDLSNLSLEKGVQFTKDRKYMTPAWVMKDYLKTDMKQVGSMYSEQASRLVRGTNFLKQNGLKSLNEVGQMVDDEFNTKLTKLNAPKLPIEQRRELEAKLSNAETSATEKKTIQDQLTLQDMPKEMKKEIAAGYATTHDSEKKLAQEMTSIISGNYLHRTAWDSALTNLRSYTYLQMMGSMPLTAITHSGVAAIKYGLPTVLRDGYMKQLQILSKGLSGAKLEDLKQVDLALDRGMDHSLRNIFDPNIDQGYESRLQQGATKVTSLFNTITGARALIGNQKYNASLLAENRLSADVMNYSSLSDKEKTYLANLHIDSSNVGMVQKQIQNHGEERDGVWFGNYKTWDDPKATQLFSLAMTKETKTLVPMAGRGDALFAAQRYQAGKQVLQFTQFFTSLTNQVLVRALQDRDAHVLQGILTTMGLGSVSYILKEKIAGREPNMNLENLIFQGMSRSALLGLLTTPTFGTLGKTLQNPSITGYWGQSGVESLLGPSAADLGDIFKIEGDAMARVHAKNDMKAQKADDAILKQFGHFIPGQNLWYLKGLFNQLNPPKQKRNH